MKSSSYYPINSTTLVKIKSKPDKKKRGKVIKVKGWAYKDVYAQWTFLPGPAENDLLYPAELVVHPRKAGRA